MTQLTIDNFSRLAARTRLSESSLRIARAVLLDGVSQTEAARREGLTRQRASDAVGRILRELRAEAGYPSSWEIITVCVPPDIGDRIRDLAHAAQRAAGLRAD